VIVNHGERRKCENLSASIHRVFRIATVSPQVQEGIRLL
jgi:predicted metal-dependent RNase